MTTMRNIVRNFFNKQTISKKVRKFQSFVMVCIICIINNEVLAMYQIHPTSIVKPLHLQFLD